MRRRSVMIAAAISVLGLIAGVVTSGVAAGKPVRIVTARSQMRLRYVRTTPRLSVTSRRATGGGTRSAARGAAGISETSERAIIKQHMDQLGGTESDAGGAGGRVPSVKALRLSSSRGNLIRTWQGQGQFESRYSGSGNAFQGEPPDQGLCASNRFVMEAVNSNVQIFTTHGRPLLFGNPGAPATGPVGLTTNEFLGLPPEFDRTNVVFGPSPSDATCYYDPAVNRWFSMVIEFAQDPSTGTFTGNSLLYLSVSRTGDPLGRWNIWTINPENNGLNGTPDHHCQGGLCFGDYPQIGADRNGFYVTTNEYGWFQSEFHGAQLYAISKRRLANGTANQITYFQNLHSSTAGGPADTVLPASSRPSSWETRGGGVEYLGMSLSRFAPTAKAVDLWAITNTSSLNSPSPRLGLQEASAGSERYAVPPLTLQKKGPTPAQDCIAIIGPSCSGSVLYQPQQETPIPFETGSGKLYSSQFANGLYWTSTSTALSGPGGAEIDATDGSWAPVNEHSGAAYFALRPSWPGGRLRANVATQGYVSVKDANFGYPSLAVNEQGVGFIGATLTGPHLYPSVVYVKVGLGVPPSSVQIAAKGKGPDDGFTGTGDGGFRPRAGDYGYAVPAAGGKIWLAGQSFSPRCSTAQWNADPTCGNTRGSFSNWTTWIAGLRP